MGLFGRTFLRVSQEADWSSLPLPQKAVRFREAWMKDWMAWRSDGRPNRPLNHWTQFEEYPDAEWEHLVRAL